MKRTFKNITSVFLALIVFISTNGIVVAAHNCFSNHKTEVSLFHKKCCSKEKEQCHSKPVNENTFSKKCCEIKISYHKVETNTPLVKNISVKNLNLFSSEILFSSVTPFFSQALAFCSAKAPPLISSGISLLLSIGTLQI